MILPRKKKRARRRKPSRSPDDAPAWTQLQLESADLYRGDKLIRRGRRATSAELLDRIYVGLDTSAKQYRFGKDGKIIIPARRT